MRIAAIGDLHCTVESRGRTRRLLAGVEEAADVLCLAGDLANVGLPEEMEVLLEDLRGLTLPIVAVVGNHDHENDQCPGLTEMMRQAGVCVLDSTVCEIGEAAFVGTKGFCGGFGKRQIAVFGEQALKTFVLTSEEEAERLGAAARTMRAEKRVALLHYAPIRDTLRGESEELYPFLGASRLADVLDRSGVNVIFHGHAHHGSPEGRTPGGALVFNVARFVLEREYGRAYRVFEI